MTMVQNCSLMLSKSTMNRPPPPGVLRHRGLEPFNPATLGSQVLRLSIYFLLILSINMNIYYLVSYFIVEFIYFFFLVLLFLSSQIK